MPIEYMFFLICSEYCIKIISSRKKCGLFSSVFKKIIPNNTTPTFQEVGWLTLPLTFVDDNRTSHGIVVTITKLIDFYSQSIFTFLFATVFTCNEPERQFTLPHGTIIRFIFLLFWFTKCPLVSIQRV